MAIIKSGASSDQLTIDATSKAARITPYDSAGREISEQSKATYVAHIAPYTPPATPTDLIVLQGSNTKTIRVISFEIQVEQTTGAQQEFYLIKRSTANTGGTGTASTIIPADSANAAVTALCSNYATNPAALGTAVGNVQRKDLAVPAATASRLVVEMLPWMVQSRLDQPITLRSTAQLLVLNFAGAALPAGMSLMGTIVWIEE